MRNAGTTVLLSAHQMQLVERLADRILLIDHGGEVLAGTMDEVRARVGAGRRLVLAVGLESGPCEEAALTACPGVERVESVEGERVVLVLADGCDLGGTLAALAGTLTIRGVHDERPTLHDVYVEAVRRRAELAGAGGAA
jgi:ABC-2 type transport system ATP-binding protein